MVQTFPLRLSTPVPQGMQHADHILTAKLTTISLVTQPNAPQALIGQNQSHIASADLTMSNA